MLNILFPVCLVAYKISLQPRQTWACMKLLQNSGYTLINTLILSFRFYFKKIRCFKS